MLYAKQTFTTMVDGRAVVVRKGDALPDDHPFATSTAEAWAGDHTADARRSALSRAARNPANQEAGTPYRQPEFPAAARSVETRDLEPTRSQALRANEAATFLPDQARDHMERMLREDADPDARLARYITVTSDRAYYRAFSAWMNDTVSGGHAWTSEERDAVQRVQWMQRSMTLGTGGAGGFLVPYEFDPSVLISSAGYVDPMRQVARMLAEVAAVIDRHLHRIPLDDPHRIALEVLARRRSSQPSRLRPSADR